MRLVILTVVALVAFASNSVLNRGALAGQGMDPALFTGIRLISGAATLALLAGSRAGPRAVLQAGSWRSAGALALYAVAFSFAYVSLDVATGALLLFGVVQMTMFGGAVLRGQRPGWLGWTGSGLGLVGLCILFLPQAQRPDPLGAALMVVAAMSWGVYSLRGNANGAPLLTTAGNFLRTVPVGLILLAPLALGEGVPPAGLALALASGAIASGLGYAIWYAALPLLDAGVAAVSQLAVPLIVLAGGLLFLGEAPPPAFGPACVLTLGGVALAILGRRRQA
ncbi:DMT family transporter [Halovulum dunhuangense]|uniref:DMT family transporter n=1 Tax=Halovulum dunhuangense TaxID=1505036 RepID=A0A849L085_9RHOB|nr:DMT family transporter [Halovulum dunhuangense]NNU79530.1 DMT family transporter [Halovulum dunhuangense]